MAEENWDELRQRLIGFGEQSSRKSYFPELQRKLEELKESEQRFRMLVENSIDVIFVLDGQGVFQFVSPAWEQHFGVPVGDVINRSFAPFVHSDDVALCMDYLTRLMESRSAATSPVYRVRHRDGSWRQFIANGSVYREPNGQLRYLGIGRDITDQMRAEQERLTLERQLLHAQKLESLGILAGGIAHDFNNILVAIIGHTDLALRRIPPESPAVNNLHKIEQAASQAADLARQMLAYSGKGRFIVENINLNRLLEEMLHMLQVSISKKATLRFNLEESIPSIAVDATQVRQIVMNLVINASEALHDTNGTIAITTGCMECDQKYLKGIWHDETPAAGTYVYLEVSDTGCGMDKETLSRIFDPFFTTKFTGRGLGMAAVLGIIRGHKGAIKVYSERGRGTTFRILLPASDSPAEPAQGAIVNDQWQGRGTVLLADDEESVRDVGEAMLQELGFQTITARDGAEALETFKRRKDIAFVILDLTMPTMDGEQCFREMRRLKPEARVIISSGFSEQEVTQKFAGAGLAGFIQKPYRFQALKEAIRTME